jgi:serine/threonine-protein kinase
MLAGSDPLFLAILPFEAECPEGDDDVARRIARRLPETLGAALGQEARVRVVPRPATPPADADDSGSREKAQQLGAHVLLSGAVRRDGSRLRVTFSVHDPWRDVQLAGGVIDGSAHAIFELEDAIAARVRRALGVAAPIEHAAPATGRPGDPAADDHYALALHHLERHDDDASLDAAIRLLERLEAGDPADARYAAGLARACLRKLKLTHSHVWEGRAAAACERAQAHDPDGFDARLAVAELVLAAGRPEEARASFVALAEREPGSSEPWLGLAQAAFALGDYEGAERACLEAIRRRDSDWRGYNRLGFVRFQRGDYPGALEAWRVVVERAPDNLRGRMNLVVVLLRLNRLEEALAEARRVVGLQPSAEAYWNLGTILYYLGRDPEAIDAFERSVALNPENPIAWGNLGNACRHVEGQGARAREALETAVGLAREELERNPAAAEMRARLAGWHSGLEHHADAVREIERALRDAPQDVHVLEIAAHVYLLRGDRDAALRWLGAAVERGYGVDEIRRSREFAALGDDIRFRALVGDGAGA